MNIFLSASIPLPTRNPQYMESADIVAIRDSVKSLVLEVLPLGKIVFGGHPAITPLIALLLKRIDPALGKNVVLYQSRYFEKYFVSEISDFFDVRIVDHVKGDRDKSLQNMRFRMLTDTKFDAGIFIGGMEGVEDEYKALKELQPKAKLFPVASTGAAADILFGRSHVDCQYLKNELSYPVLFRKIVEEIGDRSSID